MLYCPTEDEQSAAAIRILIADDHELFRNGLRLLLQSEGLKVVGEARDGAEAVAYAQQLKPDILLLDLLMPNHPGFEALKNLGSDGPAKTRVILLTGEVVVKRQIVEALQLGARGVVLKSSATDVLFQAIQTVMAEGYWVGRESVTNLMQYLRDLVRGSANETYGLTTRELEIVSAIVSGYSNKDIAVHFKISEDTVKHHISNIFNKVGVSSRLELALFAVNHSVPLPVIV